MIGLHNFFLILCDFKDNPQVLAQVGLKPNILSISTVLAFSIATFCYIFTAFGSKKTTGTTASLAFLATLVVFVIEMFLKKSASAGFVLNILAMLTLLGYTIYLAVIIFWAKPTVNSDRLNPVIRHLHLEHDMELQSTGLQQRRRQDRTRKMPWFIARRRRT